MKRRQFLAALGGAASAFSAGARAQQASTPVIGWLYRGSAEATELRLRAVRQGLSQAGFVEGRDFTFEYRLADNKPERLPALAADLVERQVTLIVAGADSAALAAKKATTTIPVVFAAGNDPVKLGLIPSLNRPGGNLTGVINLNIELGSKRLQLLRELVPAATSMTALINPTNPSAATVAKDLQTAATESGIRLDVVYAANEGQIEVAFAAMARAHTGALVIGPDAYYATLNKKIAALTVRHSMPAIFQTREFAAAGGLVSYGSSIDEQYRMVGNYTGRILKGEIPADLPVQQMIKVELIINLKSAKTLGIAVPLPLLGRADEVIE